MIGKKYGRLTIIGKAERKVSSTGKSSATRVVAKCDCGNTKEYAYPSLVRGVTQSCGCLRVEIASERVGSSSARKNKYIGVYEQGDRFVAKIHKGCITKQIGTFNTAEEAAVVRNNYIKKNCLGNSLSEIDSFDEWKAVGMLNKWL